MTLPTSGILVIDKEEDWTSHDVVAALRPVLGTRRVGHGGTLDPFATGVLPILYGRATGLATYLHEAPKTYLAEMVLGSETTTDDRTGQPTERAAVPRLDDERVRDVFARFIGPRRQRPPAYSAILVRGVRSYVRARLGEATEPPPRHIEIDEIAVVERDEACIHFLVTCSAGTYVRALARDLGRALGTLAHLGALRRIAAGGFSVDEAITVERARDLAAAGALGALVHASDVAALALRGVIVTPESARRLRAGQPVGRPLGTGVGELRAYDTGGEFVGLTQAEADLLRPARIFAPEEGTQGASR